MIYNCKHILDDIKRVIRNNIENMETKPKVAIIYAGNDEPSQRYIRNKVQDFKDVGIEYEIMQAHDYNSLISLINSCNENDEISGIIVQKPILISGLDSKHLAEVVANKINPDKDIDGVTQKDFQPATVIGMDLLLDNLEFDVSEKNAVVIGRGEVGSAVAKYLIGQNATVTICHSKTPIKKAFQFIEEADIIVGAAGLSVPLRIQPKKQVLLIDYGITMGNNGKLHGDFEKIDSNYIVQTDVPGGMGLLVRAGLLLNILSI